MQYKKEELEKVQIASLTILKEIVRICDDENLPYFIIGGTALGAVRHGGFIPWDDDIDIGMTREHYDKFIQIGPSKLGKDFFLQHYTTENNTPFYFAKVRMNNTRFVESYCKKIAMHQGIFVDIFPYDNIPDDLKLRKRHQKKVFYYSELFIAKSAKDIFTSKKGISRTMKLVVRNILHYLLLVVSKDYLFSKLDSANQEFNKIDCEYLNFVKYPFLKIKKESIINLDKIKFEGFEFSCSTNLDEYLKSHFKNYMELPAPEKRLNHRPIILEFSEK